MRRLFAIFTAILTFLTATAQVEYSIILDKSTFHKVQTDPLSRLNIDPIAKDASRNACARLKIKFKDMSRAEVDALSVKFKSNTDIARQEVAEYFDDVLILEITARPATRFYVQSPEYGQSNEVSLDLEGDYEYEMEARLNQSFSIVVDSNVAEADVYIDGIKKARTDASCRVTIKEVMIGKHTLKVDYRGIYAEQNIVVNGDNISFRVNVDTAASEAQFVIFEVNPSDAAVFINDKHYTLQDGKMSIVLDAGTYNYTVTAAGYHSKRGTFTINGKEVRQSVNLTADVASVTLSVPDNAEIWINGTKMGTGSWSGTLNSGTYIFETRKEGHRSVKTTKHITSDTASQSYTLAAPTPIAGSIMISGTPVDAQITLDGKNIGTLPLKANNILVGTHTLTISKSGYADHSQTITITEGKTATVTATLTKQSTPTPTPATTSQSGSYQIGDLVTVNGVQGIVFQTSPVVKIVSVAETAAKWSTEEVTTDATDNDCGANNLAWIKNISGWQSEYPAFKWCADLGDGWYLPAINELEAIYAHRDKINKTLSANNMDKLGSKNEYSCLWSSSEDYYCRAYYFCFSRGYDDGKLKYDSIAVRAVLALDGGTSTPTQSPSTAYTNIGGIEMVYVKGGTFTMGATAEQGSDANDDEKPTHSVTVSDFYIGKYEVTQAQWRAVMGSNPSKFTGDNNPVEQVSWKDIQRFIKNLNAKTGKKFRLPTEAEWEYAARGGNQSKGYKYSGSNNISEVDWYKNNSNINTHPVGQKRPNELGIYDMTGNVLEWCQDWKGDYSSSSQTNPTGPSRGSIRVLRGGSWLHPAGYCRVTNRGGDNPANRRTFVGFRLACSTEF